VIQDLFGEKVFPFAKPMSLLEALIDQGTEEKEGIILDFFAGSGTTGHAVMSLNGKDGGNRKFILVQLPEPTGRADYRNIAEIGKERIRRAIKKLNEEDEGKLGLTGTQQEDRGFMVYSLDESNFTLWNSELPPDEATLERQLELHVEHIRRDRTQDDLLYEVLLKSGFDLTTRIEPLTVQGKQIYIVAEGAMLLCLEHNLTPELIKAMADMKPQRVICLDEAFAGDDQVKTNAVQIMKSKGVTSFRTV
jgi:adenine-specific DNA-methyltransferase